MQFLEWNRMTKKLFHRRKNPYIFNAMIFLGVGMATQIQDVLIGPHELGILLGCH